MKQKEHYPLFVVACCFAFGIFLAQILSGWTYLTHFTMGVLFFGLIGSWWFKKKASVVLLVLIVLCGALLLNVRQEFPKNGIKGSYYSQQVDVVGRIASNVRKRKHFNGTKIDFYLIVKEIKDQYRVREVHEKILVQIFNDHEVTYGDVIHLQGKLHRPFNFSNDSQFSYPKYLFYRQVRWILSVKKKTPVVVLERGEGNVLKRNALNLRTKYEGIIDDHLSEKEAGIIKAVLLGNRTGIPKHIKGLFVQTGTAHVLAISGLHVGVIAALFLVLIKIFPIGRRNHYIFTIVLLSAYVLLTGARPSIVRATIMIDIFLASYLCERKQSSYNTLGLAGLCLLIYNPFYLFDVGFQLSFLCVSAIIFTSGKIKILKEAATKNLPSFLARIQESLLISVGIWIATAGIIAYYFLIITPITIIANLFVVPLLGVLVGLGFGLILTGSFSFYLAHMFAICIKIALNMMVGIISILNEIPFAYIYIKNVTIWNVITYYTFIGLFFLPWKKIWEKSIKFCFHKSV